MDQDPRLDEARIMEILSAPNRLRELERLGLLDSFRVDAFDRLTNLAARLLDVQTSLLSIIDADRQFFKSSAHRPDKEDEVSDRPLSYSFCKYVVGTDEPLILEDAAEHPVVQHNLGYAELGVRAYAGFPVRSRSGVVLGSFCVLDETPRHWSSDDLQTLRALTDLVIDEVRLREVMIDLAREREEHTALLDGMTEGVIGVNREGECTFANPTAFTILGWPEDELRGSTIHGAFHHSYPNDEPRPISDCPITAASVNGDDFQSESLTLWHRDGHTIPVQLDVRPIHIDGQLHGAVVVFTDLRERIASQEALQAAESRLEILVNEMPAVTFIHGRAVEDGLIFISPQIEWMLGYSPDEWVSKRQLPMQRVHPDDRDRISAVHRTAIEQELDFDEEYRKISRNGAVVWVQTRSRLVYDADGKPLYRMGIMNDISHLKRLEQRLESQAYTDSVTGLRNRAWFIKQLHGVGDANGSGLKDRLAVIFFDLDDFKVVNDSLGHQVGDILLWTIGDRVRQELPPTATVARLGGDEFTVLFESVSSTEEVQELAERILHAIRQPFEYEGRSLLPAASMGIAVSEPGSTVDPESLLTGADLAMYDAKYAGKNKIALFQPHMSSRMWDRMSIELALRRAIENEEFVVHYQPIFDLESGTVLELEALLRWQPPGEPLVPPGDFIPVAEQTGQIIEIGRWTLLEATRQVAAWRQELDLPELRLAVNLSSVQYEHPSLYRDVIRALEESDLPADRLTLEITESWMLRGTDEIIETLADLRSTGARLAIDDFGTGFSSLGYLRQYTVDALKIDRSFIEDVVVSPGDAAIVQSVIAVARTLNLDVTAEGIETGEQEEVLRSLGCHHGQGFYLARPMPAENMTEFLTQ